MASRFCISRMLRLSSDIVFVHGITGHRDNTWAANKTTDPWPRLMLPSEIPDARLLTFGYDASVIGWRGSISGNRLSDHSNNLLSSIATFRAADDTEERPIIFVMHSLGGLVVKDALLSSSTSPERHLQQVYDSTRGLLFLGTPHSGVSLASVAERLIRVVNGSSKANLHILKVLKRDSEVLSRIQSGFHALLRAQQRIASHPLEITCFYEELPIQGVGEIVPKDSAVIYGYPAIGIHHDHRGMARFDSKDDPGFASVVGELRRWIEYIEYGPPGSPKQHDQRTPQPSSQEGVEDSEIGHLRGSTGSGSITIWGNVVKSIVVSGTQRIEGNLSFRD
ncbi:putative SesB-related regulatory protein [Xylariomycetidae sp. FL0641]|nr:putative SesB-related regulatory protein [Xylariomycetidae sp. FL0641]